MEPQIVTTDGMHPDFALLSRLVDDEYYDLFGEVVLKYRQYNTLDAIRDVVLLYHDVKPIACGAFKPYDEHTVEIKRVFVRKDCRKRGFATLLMYRLEEIAKSKGYQKAVLQTGAVMNDAISLYKSLGYRIIDNFGDFENDDLCVCMKKQL